jgi:archaellum component FlaC
MNAGKQDEVNRILEAAERLKTEYSEVFSEFYSENSDKLDASAEAIQELSSQKNSEDNEFYQKLAFNFYISNSIDDF